MKLLALSLSLLGLLPAQVFSQFYPVKYRPADLEWQQLVTPHFRVIFPLGEDTSAWNTAYILERHYRSAQDLTGGSLRNFPVVLNNYNDIANGFVSPRNFRSEIQLTPFKGKALNPKTGAWLETVVPHELVHALHFNNMGGTGLTRLVRLFSPDAARAIHGAVPFGVHEGLAVHYETEHLSAGGGRGNYPFFTNQFNAVFDSPQRWSMGQMLQVASKTRPFNRHYIGGYEMTSWLQNTYGSETSKEAIRFYANYPFLGYGVALRHVTGKWPGQLYKEFEEFKKHQPDSDDSRDYQEIPLLPIQYDGASIRRPKWLSDSTLVLYGSFYNARSGFYKYDLNSNRLIHIATSGIVQDYSYDLSPDKSRLIYSYYETSPIYNNNFATTLVELDLDQKSLNYISGRHLHLYSPDIYDTGFLALRPDRTFNELVHFTPGEKPEVTPLASVKRTKIVDVALHPTETGRLAVVAKKQGYQALWTATVGTLDEALQNEPEVVFSKGSVFDPVWHPKGDRILFSSDESGVLNIYEYNPTTQRITQITDSRYNAFEADYSPDGNRIAFVVQRENKQLPAVMNREDFHNREVIRSGWKLVETVSKSQKNTKTDIHLDTTGIKWETSSYKSGVGWLKPRAVFPIVEEVSNRDVYKTGVSIHSGDLLQEQSYSAEMSFLQNRLWYDLTYKNTSYYPGFEVSLRSKPSYVSLPFDITVDTVRQTMLRQERSLSLSVPMDYTLKQNVFYSSFFIRPQIRQSQIRYFELDHSGTAASDFADVTIANLYGAIRYRLQQNIRDMQPNSGIILFSEFEQYLWPTGLTIQTLNSQYPRSFFNSFALRGGVFAYLSPFREWNQSLRLDVRAVNQNQVLFDNQFLVSEGFSEPVFPFSKNLLSFGTRYTIPVWFPDNGGFLLPAYLGNIYLVAFTNTVGTYTEPGFFSSSRTVVGAGVRARFRLSNLAFDLGVGIGYEPSRNNANIFIGNF